MEAVRSAIRDFFYLTENVLRFLLFLTVLALMGRLPFHCVKNVIKFIFWIEMLTNVLKGQFLTKLNFVNHKIFTKIIVTLVKKVIKLPTIH